MVVVVVGWKKREKKVRVCDGDDDGNGDEMRERIIARVGKGRKQRVRDVLNEQS